MLSPSPQLPQLDDRRALQFLVEDGSRDGVDLKRTLITLLPCGSALIALRAGKGRRARFVLPSLVSGQAGRSTTETIIRSCAAQGMSTGRSTVICKRRIVAVLPRQFTAQSRRYKNIPKHRGLPTRADLDQIARCDMWASVQVTNAARNSPLKSVHTRLVHSTSPKDGPGWDTWQLACANVMWFDLDRLRGCRIA